MNLVEDPRAAGEVRRYHTWAVHRDQSVGEHTWQVMRILLTVWPDAPRKTVIHALIHDSGEMSGDIQYPFKLMFPELRAGSDKAENHVISEQRRGIGAPNPGHPPSPFEKVVLKIADNLEMWEYGLREMNLGNLYAKLVVSRMASAVAHNLDQLEALKGTQQYQANVDVINNVRRYMKTRTEMEAING